MNTADAGRVFVGVDGSLASLRAVRRAVREARRCGAELHVVHVRPPTRLPGYKIDALGFDAEVPQLDQSLKTQADRLMNDWLECSVGGAPSDIVVHRRLFTGKPGPVLVGLGCQDGDLIVVGATDGRWWHRLVHGSVSKYCVAHAHCPVLAVPLDSFARTMRPTRFGAFLLRRNVWKRFDAATTRGRQHIE